MDFWPEDVPERFRGNEPNELADRVAYLEFWAGRLKDPGVQKRLATTRQKLAEAHECKCCGIILTATPGDIGPECAHHPGRFPCNAHRGR